MNIDNNLFEYIKNCLNKDNELIDFYNKNYINYSDIDINEYLYNLFIDNQDLCLLDVNDLAEANKKIRKGYTNSRLRLSKKGSVGSRLISYSLVNKCKEKTIKSIVDNEIKLILIQSIINYKTNITTTVERPISIDGIYTTNEKTTLFDANNSLNLNNKKAYMSKDIYQRQIGMIQPLLFTNSSTEIVFVKKGEKSYLKSKSLDTKDQKIMDFLVNEYKKIMYYPDPKLIFPLYKISNLIYNNKSKRYLDLTQQRLNKISNNGQIVFNADDIDKDEIQFTNETINNYKLVNFFEVEFYTNKDIRYCSIYMSRSIENDLKTNNTIKLYKNKIDKIENNFTSILVNYIQSLRINSLLKNEYEITIPYKILKMSIMMPYSRSKVKNIDALKISLQELVSLEFLIYNFEIKNTYIKLYFLQFGPIELNELNLKDKMNELKI